MNKSIYSTSLNVLSFCAVLLSTLTGCLDFAGTCNTKVAKRISNFNKTVQAVVIVTDCGATTSPSCGVRLIEGVNERADGDPENTILGSNKGVDLRWISNDTLTITGADTTNGFIMKDSIRIKGANITIRVLYRK